MSVNSIFSPKSHDQNGPSEGSRLEGPVDPEGLAEAINFVGNHSFSPAMLFGSNFSRLASKRIC